MDQPTPVPVFLDFEGVLRPTFNDGPFSSAKNLVEPLREARAMGLFPALVIASTYRLKYPWKDLAALLETHAPGIGEFICGCTPRGGDYVFSEEDAERQSKAPRLFEAMTWMRTRGAPLGWIAIDDTKELYGPNDAALPRELLLCDGAQGFTEADANKLREKFSAMATLRQSLAAAGTGQEAGASSQPAPR